MMLFLCLVSPLRRPSATGEERRHIGHDKAKAIQDSPSNDDPLQPGTGLVNRPSGSGEVHQKKRNGSRNNCGNSADTEDLRIHILHDRTRLRPMVSAAKARVENMLSIVGITNAIYSPRPTLTFLNRSCSFLTTAGLF